MKRLLPLFLLPVFLLSTSEIKAQEVVIGSFYSQGTNSTEIKDWVEIKNVSNLEKEITGFRIEDTAPTNSLVHDWGEKTFLPALGSCVVDVGDRLNQGGDVIFLKDSLGNQIDCVLYSEGNGGNCTKVGESSEATVKPLSGCFSPTPPPSPTPVSTQTPTASPTPTPTKTPTPVVTKIPTPKPTKTPSKTPLSEVLGEEVTSGADSPSPISLVVDSTEKKVPILPIVFIGLGVLMVGFAVYNLVRARKNPTPT